VAELHVERHLSVSYPAGLFRPSRLCVPRGYPPNRSMSLFLVTRFSAGLALFRVS
jgi:hypothetical protein